MTLKQIVAFCVLMENNDGIVGKAPLYIREKFNSCKHRYSEDELLALLDSRNQAKYREYMKTWGIKEDFNID